MRFNFSYLMIAAFSMIVSFASAQVYQTCDRWGNFTTGGYTVYNNIWGARSGQCLTAFNYNNWYVDATFTKAINRGGIKSYPNVEKKTNLFVDNMGALSTTFGMSVANSGSYTAAYDIWYDNYAYEVMLWMNWTGAVGPISYSYSCNGACPEATNVSVGGHTWNVYRGSNGANEVFSFIRTSNTSAGTIDLTAISQWIRNRGWFGNANLHSIQFGFEITSTVGTQRFSVNDFSVTGTGVTAARASTVTNVSETRETTESSASVFPNPVETSTTLTISEEFLGGNASLMTINGKMLQTKLIKQMKEDIDMTGLPSGLYVVQLNKDRRQQTLKVLKR
jgi:hypothetical protein